MQAERFVNFGTWLQIRRNFMWYGTLGVGVPLGLGGIWICGGYGGYGFALFLAVLGLVGGWVWAYFMWMFFDRKRRGKADSPTSHVGGHGSV